MRASERDKTVWIGIPSVPARRVGQAFLSFYIALTIATVVDVLLVLNNHGPVGWQRVAEAIFDDGSSIVGWALAGTWPIMEVFRIMLASLWENRIRRRAIEQGLRQGLEQGREEGIEENQRLWEAWNERRIQAQERGEPFDEPPPSIGANRG